MATKSNENCLCEARCNDRLLCEKQLATRWGCSIKVLQKWRYEGGAAPAFCKIRGMVRYRLSDVVAFEDASIRGSTSEQPWIAPPAGEPVK